METVVILDHDSKNIEGYKRMLEASREQIDCRFIKRPEDFVDFQEKNPVAVVISEVAIPNMPGKEVFDLVEMISPSTIRIAMTQAEDISEILEVYNKVKIFKMILKPFYLPEDIVHPIQEALKYYKNAQAEEQQRKNMELELEKLNLKLAELNQKLDKKKRKYTGIYHVALGIIRGNLNSGIHELDMEAGSQLSEICEELLKEFMHCYMEGDHELDFYVEKLKKQFHHPEDKCILRIQNKTGEDIPQELAPKIAYGMFLGCSLCRWLLVSYRSVLLLEKEGEAYMMKIFCQYPEKGRIYRISGEKERKFLVSMIKEAASSLSDHIVIGSKKRQFALKLYFGKWKGREAS